VNIFKQYAAQGQSFFQASGDQGAYWSSGYYTSAPPPITTSPLMTVVGGTRLTPTLAWRTKARYLEPPQRPLDPQGYYAASGAATSRRQPGPYPDIPIPLRHDSASSVYRTIPDDSLTARNALSTRQRHAGAFGGTSAAAPLWAGVMALVNQQAHAAGRGSIGNANPPLYTLALNASDYAAYYHDITTGHNNYDGTNPAYYPAGTKFDLATGLGSPRCELVAALAALAPTATPTPIYYPPGTYPTAVPQVISSLSGAGPLSREGFLLPPTTSPRPPRPVWCSSTPPAPSWLSRPPPTRSLNAGGP
jgi:kumamolisin